MGILLFFITLFRIISGKTPSRHLPPVRIIA
jgi:hypothetical protein